MLKVLGNLVYPTDKHFYIGVSGLKQAQTQVPLLALKHLRRKEIGCQTLHDQLVVSRSLVAILLGFLLTNQRDSPARRLLVIA